MATRNPIAVEPMEITSRKSTSTFAQAEPLELVRLAAQVFGIGAGDEAALEAQDANVVDLIQLDQHGHGPDHPGTLVSYYIGWHCLSAS